MRSRPRRRRSKPATTGWSSTFRGAALQIEGDATRLSQVFQNLLDNAAKYTPPGGTITLRAEQRGEQIQVSVRDTGIGIAREAQPRVFELFTRVHPDDRIKTSGLGIGLSLAKKLIELHLGDIEVRSEGPGMGSEFIVTLPALAAAPAPKRRAETPRRTREAREPPARAGGRRQSRCGRKPGDAARNGALQGFGGL